MIMSNRSRMRLFAFRCLSPYETFWIWACRRTPLCRFVTVSPLSSFSLQTGFDVRYFFHFLPEKTDSIRASCLMLLHWELDFSFALSLVIFSWRQTWHVLASFLFLDHLIHISCVLHLPSSLFPKDRDSCVLFPSCLFAEDIFDMC